MLAGIAICFDIVDDQLMTRDAWSEGAQVIFAQTNNADFGRTDESVQQLAIARIRAIETRPQRRQHLDRRHERDHLPGRLDRRPAAVVHAGIMVDDVPLSTTMTPAS